MKKILSRLTFLFAGLIMAGSLTGQIQIGMSDMPEVGYTYTIYTTTSVPSVYTQAGANFSWDFTTLTPESNAEMKYLPMDSVPSLLVTAFNLFAGSNVATMAIAAGAEDMEGSPIPVEEAYAFYANNSTGFKNLGIGFIMSGFPVPIRYDNPDVIFAFPLEYEDTYASDSYMEINLPNYIFYSTQINRSSEVDGWGTIALPNDTFDVLRVKATVITNDSIYIDSLGIGFQMPEQTSYEYYWLAAGEGMPVLTVREESTGLVTAEFTSYPVISTPEYSLFKESAQVFRSGDNELSISVTIDGSTQLTAVLYDQLGREVETLINQESVQGKVELKRTLKASNLKGIFYVQLLVGKEQVTKAVLF